MWIHEFISIFGDKWLVDINPKFGEGLLKSVVVPGNTDALGILLLQYSFVTNIETEECLGITEIQSTAWISWT